MWDGKGMNRVGSGHQVKGVRLQSWSLLSESEMSKGQDGEAFGSMSMNMVETCARDGKRGITGVEMLVNAMQLRRRS